MQRPVLFALASALLFGCSASGSASASTTPAPASTTATASLSGLNITGVVTFVEKDGVVTGDAAIAGLEPGLHGFHLHETGDCSGEGFKSAGGHFNPTGTDHGAPGDEQHHLGDLGNLKANDEGVAAASVAVPGVSLTGDGGPSIVGRAVIVHANADDLESQPSGAAGPRVACGVIETVEGS